MKVITFGNFDIIHPGHIAYLKFAKLQGSKLYTIVATDYFSEKIKGRVNINKEDKRKQDIIKLNIADVVLLGSKTNPFESILKIKPDVIVLGYDQKAPINEIKKLFPKIKILKAPEFKPSIFKSSIIKKNAKLN